MDAFADALWWSSAGWPPCSLFESRAWRGQLIHVAKGPLARTFQRSFGDLLIATGPGGVASIEIKVQRRWTGRLFLEGWSNKNLDSQASHVERGSTPGWLITCRADVVGFHFLDADTAPFLPLFRLQQWAFGTGDQGGRIYDFPERRQRRYVQRNDLSAYCAGGGARAGSGDQARDVATADIAGAAMMRSTGWSQCYSAPADRRRYHKYQIQRPMTAHRSVAPAAPVARPRAAASGSSLSSGSMTNGMSQVSGYQVQRRQRRFRHLFDPRRPGEHVAAGGGRGLRSWRGAG